jgi:hypothetical protein
MFLRETLNYTPNRSGSGAAVKERSDSEIVVLGRFGPEYSDMAGLTYDSWDVDKRILADLKWRAWDEVARELQEQLTHDVIERAVRRQPPELLAKDGERMIAGLKSRRDGLPAQAKRYCGGRGGATSRPLPRRSPCGLTPSATTA